MKKTLFLVVLLIFMGCSSTQIEKNQKQEMATYQEYYDNWEIEKLNSKILEIKSYDKELATKLEKASLKRQQDKKEFEKNLNDIRFFIESGDISRVKESFVDTIANRELLKFLKENNFGGLKIVIGETKFYKETASNLIGIICSDQVVYILVDYELVDNNWRVKRWKLKES